MLFCATMPGDVRRGWERIDGPHRRRRRRRAAGAGRRIADDPRLGAEERESGLPAGTAAPAG
jgi:hypothetical protein